MSPALSGTVAPSVVAAALERDGRLAREALLAYIPSGGPRTELYDLVADYPSRPGKGIRPALCLATCRAFGGTTEDALPAAAAIEMLHNAFLVHDDISDAAETRRGAPALHVRHGVPLAMNAGSALAWMALRPLLDNVDALGARRALEVLSEFDHLTRRTMEGQAVELGWRDRDWRDADVDTYLHLVLGKTCWYSAIHPCRVGALIGSRGTADLDALADFGFFLGAVLQIRDDVENVSDRAGVHGKDHGTDILEGKPTLLLVHLLQHATVAQRDELTSLIGPAGAAGGATPQERIDRVIELMDEHGSIDYACAFADAMAGGALAEFEEAMGHLQPTEDKDVLRSVVLYLRDPLIRGR